MLAAAAKLAPSPRLRFEKADLRGWTPAAPLDCIVSNAALQWVDDHAALLARLVGFLAPGGALAVQMPHNDDAPTHDDPARAVARPALRRAARRCAARAPRGRAVVVRRTPARARLRRRRLGDRLPAPHGGRRGDRRMGEGNGAATGPLATRRRGDGRASSPSTSNACSPRIRAVRTEPGSRSAGSSSSRNVPAREKSLGCARRIVGG